ncbi:GNAT family N-acetyltransferase [Devosia sp. SL43]|uniref:GNAT family N-acetyltransferase n=1 Tax=Devosia sp. SL43 TaxID=2806348 RepID=UPI001F37A46E|nr:GNAT family N-acetyltransferase [Devosia sp. SL43]
MAALVSLDSVATLEPARVAEIAAWIDAGFCFLASRDGQPVGYGVLHHHFFHRGMLELVMVDPRHRRSGIGQAIIRHAIANCRTPQLWTSTNQSNAAMQALLAQMGFVPSGIIEGLDADDPEMIYRIETAAPPPFVA